MPLSVIKIIIYNNDTTSITSWIFERKKVHKINLIKFITFNLYLKITVSNNYPGLGICKKNKAHLRCKTY